MKPPPFDYFRPANLDDAIAILAKTENAKVLAGGQSLMPMLNLRYVFPDALVDINNVFELDELSIGNKGVRIGALTRQRRLERDEELGRAAPIFREALALVGHRQTRNRGTIGGSLCHLDPASELSALALLHDASVEAAGLRGRRAMLIRGFIGGFMTPNITSDELVTAIEFALWPPGHGYAFKEFARRHGDFAIASAGCLMTLDPTGRIERCAIVIGGLGSTPQRHSLGEERLIGSSGDAAAQAAAVEACSALEAVGDFHGGADYRLSVARTMLRRALDSAIARARGVG